MKTAAIYVRVSTESQTTENQRIDLERDAKNLGVSVTNFFEDFGISGAKSRYERPGLNAMLQAATRREFDVVLIWSVDRLGRSLEILVNTLSELDALGVSLYVHQHGTDTSTPNGRMMIHIAAVFAEFERAITIDRITTGLTRARAQGRVGGRPKVDQDIEAKITDLRAQGLGILKIAKTIGVCTSVVQRVVSTKDESPTASRI